MTSAAPGTEAQAEAAAAKHHKANAAAPFDLENPAVQNRVTAFQTHLRGFFDNAMTRGAKYLPSMRDILVREGLPAELAYLPLIESGYRPQAVSPAGAAGPWQFIPATGRRYGLRIDALVDERRDPIKSTEAASAYLKDLHEMFGDWELSLAAYNTGEYRVARILAEQKDVEDYWDMRERGYLPSETSQYVPKFLAAVQIARAPEDYGFEAPSHHTPEHYEMVDVERTVSLRVAADMCGVTASELAELNPALRSGVTPSGYSLRVPAGKAEPLRVGLATYVEPVHARRTVARSTRGSDRSGRSIARGGRATTAVAQGRKTAERLAKTAPVRSRRGAPVVQTAKRPVPSLREAKLDTRSRTAPAQKPASKSSAGKKSVERTAKSQPSPAKAVKKAPAPAPAKKPRRG